MNCQDVMDRYVEAPEGLSLLDRGRLWAHLLCCPRCAREIQVWEDARDLLREASFPPAPAPGLESLIMAAVLEEEAPGEEREEAWATPSFRSWVLTGMVVLVSLTTAAWGRELGASYFLPLGLIIGGIVTAYGALFISSHLKELSHRFGLRQGL